MTKDTNATGGAAIKRYKIGYHTDEWGVRSSTPGGIPGTATHKKATSARQ